MGTAVGQSSFLEPKTCREGGQRAAALRKTLRKACMERKM